MNEVVVADKTVTANGNKIVLRRAEHTGGGRNCYYSWRGTYQVISCTRPITQADMDMMIQDGVFGTGQVVDASIAGDVISYSGSCDSSG